MATTTFFLPLLLQLIFFFFSVFSTITTAQQTRISNIIPIESSLTPTNNTNSSSSWLSRSGRFAFGFYPQDGGFVDGIWFAGIPQKTVVWTAPVLVKQTDSNNFRLRLTRVQGLVLQSTQEQSSLQDQSISADISRSTSYASMLDTGNMVIYNSKSAIIWQSFDSPTNTILQGQRLKTGRSLFSSVSEETDYSKGRFQLIMQLDGNLVLYPAQRREVHGYAYWNTGTNNGDKNMTVNLDDNGHLYLVNSNGTNIKNVSLSDNEAPNGTMFYRLTIDTNGILNLYSHNLLDSNGDWSVEWTTPDDKCSPKGLCGLNGYCILLDQKFDCLCLPGFNFIDTDRRSL